MNIPTPSVLAAFVIAVQAGAPPFLLGEPGTAKSALHECAARTLGYHQEVVVASLLFDSSDVNGIHYVKPDGQLGHVLAPFIQRCLDADAAGLVPWMFFDELPTAQQSVRAGLLRVVTQLDVNGTKLPASTRFSAAGNPLEQGEGGSRLSAAMANRFVHIEWDMDREWMVQQAMAGYPDPSFPVLPPDWEKYLDEARALTGQFMVSPAGLDHTQKCPVERKKQAGAWPSYRSWETTNRCLAALGSLSMLGTVEESILLEGAVGEPSAQMFLAWRRELDLPNPEAVLRHPRAWAADRGDRVLVTLLAVARQVDKNKTQARYEAAFEACVHAQDQGFLDVAAMCAGKLCSLTGQKGGHKLKPPRRLLKPFIPFLSAAGYC